MKRKEFHNGTGSLPRLRLAGRQHNGWQSGGKRRTIRPMRERMVKNTQRKKLFAGRDKSWMNFNRRVLEEACDEANPVLERVKFLAITGSNLDEYVEIRLAGLLQRSEDGHTDLGYDGLTAQESLKILTDEIHAFVAEQYSCWNDRVLPELRKQKIRLLQWEELTEHQRTEAQAYFHREVDPLLTPITIRS